MPINPEIALGVKGIDVQDPLAQYGRLAMIRNAQQQNALAQIQLQEQQQQIGANNALNKAYANAYNPQTGELNLNNLRSQVAASGYGSKLPAIEKSIAEANVERAKQQQLQGQVLDAAIQRSRGYLESIDPNSPNAANEYMAWHQANHADPILGPALNARGLTLENSAAHINQMMNTPGGLAQLIQESKLGAEKFAELNKAQLSTTDLGGQVISRAFSPLTGKLSTIASQQKTMAPGQAKSLSLESRRLALAEQNAAREADPEFQQRMAEAKSTGQAIAQGKVSAMQSLPGILTRAEEGINLIDTMIGKRDSSGKLIGGSAPHPGFENAVGSTWRPFSRLVPGTDAADFMTYFDQIHGTAFLSAYESLKGSGAISDKEGEKATSAISRMSTASSEKEFIKAGMELQDVLRKGVENAQKRAGKTVIPAQTQSSGVKFLGFE